jgi:hypothetical protein
MNEVNGVCLPIKKSKAVLKAVRYSYLKQESKGMG